MTNLRVAVASCLALIGCSGGGADADGGSIDAAVPDAAGCQPYVSSADLTTPVSFTGQVEPIFQQSCALSASCHGDPAAAPVQPYLGSVDGGTDAATLLAKIVGVPSAEDPTMNLVTAGDPANSFLVHKMDGDQCTLAAQCAGTAISMTYANCGASMPSGIATLPASIRDTVRAWIKQGAR